MGNTPAIIHFTGDIVCLTGNVDKYLITSFAERIPNMEYDNSPLDHAQLGAQVSFLFENVQDIDAIISSLEDLKQVYDALKNR